MVAGSAISTSINLHAGYALQFISDAVVGELAQVFRSYCLHYLGSISLLLLCRLQGRLDSSNDDLLKRLVARGRIPGFVRSWGG
jgi:hypothetical protein